MKELKIEDLEYMSELIPNDSNLKKSLEILSSSINDWPTSINNIDEFEKQVKMLINNEINERNINLFLSEFSALQLSNQAWKIEAISELVDIFHYYPNNISFKEIIINIQKELENYVQK